MGLVKNIGASYHAHRDLAELTRRAYDSGTKRVDFNSSAMTRLYIVSIEDLKRHIGNGIAFRAGAFWSSMIYLLKYRESPQRFDNSYQSEISQ